MITRDWETGEEREVTEFEERLLKAMSRNTGVPKSVVMSNPSYSNSSGTMWMASAYDKK
jgi:hypothetical protein